MHAFRMKVMNANRCLNLVNDLTEEELVHLHGFCGPCVGSDLMNIWTAEGIAFVVSKIWH